MLGERPDEGFWKNLMFDRICYALIFIPLLHLGSYVCVVRYFLYCLQSQGITKKPLHASITQISYLITLTLMYTLTNIQTSHPFVFIQINICETHTQHTFHTNKLSLTQQLNRNILNIINLIIITNG